MKPEYTVYDRISTGKHFVTTKAETYPKCDSKASEYAAPVILRLRPLGKSILPDIYLGLDQKVLIYVKSVLN